MLSASAFADITDSKIESEKPAVTNAEANKLSDEEIGCSSRRVEEIYSLDKPNFTSKEKNDLKKNHKATQRISRRDGVYIYIG